MDNKNTSITFLTLRQFALKHKFITLAALRQLVHNSKDFDKACIRRLGKRVLINEEKTLEYIESLSRN